MPKKLKKDFDRDKMYSKIMPTLGSETEHVEEERVIAKKVPVNEPIIQLELSSPRLHNFMEDMLREKLPHTMKVLRACPCERCQMDILSIALNSLPPSYAVTELDDGLERVKKLRREYEVKVTATLIKAIQQVKNNPRHGDGGQPPLV